MAPTTIAIIIDVTTLYIVKNSPNRLYVANIESTPVIGVDIRKLVTAPLLAPSLCRVLAIGITEQEQRGRGAPNRVDFTIEPIPLSPRCLYIKLSGITCFNRPATITPKIYIDSWSLLLQIYFL